MYRRLLVPLDGSCLAEAILVVVARLAARPSTAMTTGTSARRTEWTHVRRSRGGS
jgi:hypothetical protein